MTASIPKEKCSSASRLWYEEPVTSESSTQQHTGNEAAQRIRGAGIEPKATSTYQLNCTVLSHETMTATLTVNS